MPSFSRTATATTTPGSAPPEGGDLRREIASLAPWFHNLHLPRGVQTCPDHWLGDFPSFKWQQLATHLPQDLAGWSCLDIGCNAGFYTFELAGRGASVLGIDVDERYLRQARWAAQKLGMTESVRFRQMQVYELARLDETFDLVMFMGVLYHLRYPMLGLDIVSKKVRRLMVFQSLTTPGEDVYEPTHGHDFNDRDVLRESDWPKMAFLEHPFAGDPTNWWAPNHACVEAMLRSAGMRVVGRPGHEVYLCQPDTERPSCMTTWNRAEYDAATGGPYPRLNDE